MFDHVTIRVSDRDASERFYDTVLPTIGVEKTHAGADFAEWGDFSLTRADDQTPPTRRLHVAFHARTRELVDAFWRAGTAAGYPDEGAPGPRPQYRHDYYGAFLLDPDGNSIEAVHHGDLRGVRVIDHLWIRVADVAAAKRFYETVAPHVGMDLGIDEPDHAQFGDGTGSFSLVAGEPTEGLHMAFGVTDDAAVDAFHRATTAAGYRDNGAPGERPEYHAGYYAGFVRDPDGHNIELVNHHRESGK